MLTLTAQELVDLTGYKQRARQIKWLSQNKFTFRVARGGRPVVDCAH